MMTVIKQDVSFLKPCQRKMKDTADNSWEVGISEENEAIIGPVTTLPERGHRGGKTSGMVLWGALQNFSPKSNDTAGQNWPKQPFQYSGEQPEAYLKKWRRVDWRKTTKPEAKTVGLDRVLASGGFHVRTPTPPPPKQEPAVSLLEGTDLI